MATILRFHGFGGPLSADRVGQHHWKLRWSFLPVPFFPSFSFPIPPGKIFARLVVFLGLMMRLWPQIISRSSEKNFSASIFIGIGFPDFSKVFKDQKIDFFSTLTSFISSCNQKISKEFVEFSRLSFDIVLKKQPELPADICVGFQPINMTTLGSFVSSAIAAEFNKPITRPLAPPMAALLSPSPIAFGRHFSFRK